MKKLKDLIRILALGCAIKGTQLTAAKKAVPQGDPQTFDFWVRLRGSVTREPDKPIPASERPGRYDPFTPDVMSVVLEKCGVDPAKFKRALRNACKKDVKHELVASDAHLDVIADVFAEIQPTLDPVTMPASTRTGKTLVTPTSIEYFDKPPAKASAK